MAGRRRGRLCLRAAPGPPHPSGPASAVLWPVFAAARARLQAQGALTWPGVFHNLADHYGARTAKPFTHIVVDEAHNLDVPELRLLVAIAPQRGAPR